MSDSTPGAPSGTVTFLFTDIEGSTLRWERSRSEMRQAHARQEAILRDAIASNGGYAYKMIGDAFQAAFPTAPQALQAALDAQRALQAETWGEGGDLLVRMALHTGITEERESDYVGPILNRVARLLAAGHGGQVLLTGATEQLLRDELPSGVALLDQGEHRLKDLTRPERIYQMVADGLPSDFPPLKTLDYRPNNLPEQPTPLVGRERELEDIRRLLGRGSQGSQMEQETGHARLVTLTGPGGTGKTRLALQLAADLLDYYTDGVWLVDLSPVTEPALVLSTVAQVLGVKERPGEPLINSLKAYLQDKHSLLVLDNFEQVMEAAPQVGALLGSSHHLQMLVTSRAPLRIRAEHEYSVPPLQLPDARQTSSMSVEQLGQYEAVRLFVERAQAVKTDFGLTGDNMATVAQICMRLDGLPLAIELAAARVRLLPPEAMLVRLQNRLKILTGGARDLPARQQTIRNTIEWSHDLLDDSEKQLFRRLAAFQGGRRLEAIEAVCNANGDLEVDVLDGVESLVSKSLLQQREGVGGEARLVMLETINEYAREKLQESGEAEEMARQHALYFLSLAETAAPYIVANPQPQWLDRLDEEHDNFRAALAWARGNAEGGAAGTLGIALRLVSALWRFWFRRDYLDEGREQLQQVLDDLNRSPLPAITSTPAPSEEADSASITPERRAYANALNGAGVLAHAQGDFITAKTFYERALAIRKEVGDKRGTAALLSNIATINYELGNLDGAIESIEEALVIFREIGDNHNASIALNNLGNISEDAGDYTKARALHEESLALRRALNDKWGTAMSLHNLGGISYDQGDYATALFLQKESLALQREVGDTTSSIRTINALGSIERELGEYARSHELHSEALTIARELNNKPEIGMSLLYRGSLAQLQGDYEAARALYRQSLDILREVDNKAHLSQALEALAHLALDEDNYSEAEALYKESLAIRHEIGHRRGKAICIMGLAAVNVQKANDGAKQSANEESLRSATLLGAVDAQLEDMGVILGRLERTIYDRTASAARQDLGEAEFEAARQEGRTLSLDEVVNYTLRKS